MVHFLLFMFRVCHVFLFFNCSLVVTCWERADLLALLYIMFYNVILSPSHVMSWVRCTCLIVSIPDICLLSYFMR